MNIKHTTLQKTLKYEFNGIKLWTSPKLIFKNRLQMGEQKKTGID